jgi:hypothetical protein
LAHLKDKIEDEEKPWDQTLSGGEKQGLAFARLFLHNPDIVVLDEATSALDAKGQDNLMESPSRSCRARLWSASRIVPNLRIFTTAKSCWQDARAAQNSSAISTLCPARAKSGYLADGCVGPNNLAMWPRRGNILLFQKGRPACYDAS